MINTFNVYLYENVFPFEKEDSIELVRCQKRKVIFILFGMG